MSHATSPPSIRIYDSGPSSVHSRYALQHQHRSSSFHAAPMAIPNARASSPPPPLPPPRYINDLNEDHAWNWANATAAAAASNGSHGQQQLLPQQQQQQQLQLQQQLQHNHHHHQHQPAAAQQGSGLPACSSTNSPPSPEDRSDLAPSSRRTSTYSPTGTPSGESAMESSDRERNGHRPSLVDYRLQSERQLGQKSLESSSNAYDKQLLSKIGGPNTPTRTQAPGFLSTSAQDVPNPPAPYNNPKGQLKPLSMPERLYTSSLESPAARWASSGTVSPGQSGFRSPVYDSSESMSSRLYPSTSATTEEPPSATRSHGGSYEQGIFSDHEFAMEENGMRDLKINDRSPGAEEYHPAGGLKRRASSPPSDAAREDRPTGNSGSDLYHRRSQQMLVNRNSPVSRFHANNNNSLSSASSFGGQRTGSYGSSYGLSMASTATSYNERLSPGALSPSAEAELGPMSPFVAANRAGQPAHNPSPRGSVSRASHQQMEPPHNRKMSSDSLIHSRHNSVSKMSGLYICECCPKKPKKFESEEELRNHELEKQYTCAFCPNRFKNKNEAERHQNSLHLRRHSWSCAALEGPHAAFHASTSHPGAADVCGYCGKEFSNPPNWDERNDHLNHTHKFGECNQAKKFFRADHFRQHLKHSHAGSSGKWTNMLENACMKDEPPPPPLSRLPARSHMSSYEGAPGSGLGPGVINEVHDEN